MTTALFEHEVKESLEKLDQSFSQGQPEFFDAFAKDAKIFTVDRNEPITGREAYRSSYQDALCTTKREKTVLARNMQIVGDKCVVNQTARITENGSAVDVSQTMVYGLTEEGVRILHFHTGLLAPNGTDASSVVRVVNERIATTMTASGVAQ
jgi:hypothetical protein